MRLRTFYTKQEPVELNVYDWFKALVNAGLSPESAWNCNYTEAVHILDIKPVNTDKTAILYHQRKSNGAPESCLELNH